MKIKSAYIDQLFNEFDYDIELFDTLTFLHSPNGFGKSTLMHLISSSLKGDLKYISDTMFQRMDIGFDEGTVLIVENNGGDLLIQMQRNELETKIDEEEMASLCDVIYIPPERLVLKKRDGHLASALDAYAQELYESIRYAKELGELRPPSKDIAEGKSDAELEFLAKDLKAKLDFIKDGGLEPNLPPRLRFPPSRYELTSNRDEYVQLIGSIADYVDRNYNLAESIIVFKDIVNEIFINKSVVVSESGKLGIQMDNGTALQLSRLSSGEKQILIMFYILLFHATPGSLVIVDEPEISLHVSWQQKLADLFLNICRVRNLQMIVATHSPQVIHDKWDLTVELRPGNA